MPDSNDLSEAFYSGTLIGEPLSGQDLFANQYLSISGDAGALTFGQTEYDAAIEQGYSDNDINQFLQESGVQAEGDMFQVGGMNEYSGTVRTGKETYGTETSTSLYWQVSPSYNAPPPTPTGDSVTVAPAGDTVEKTLDLPNDGTGTIETIAPLPESISAPIPILGDPLGESSQRVQIKKAKLSSTAT